MESVSNGVAMACHSLPEAQRGTAGAVGAAGRAQQDGVEQVAGSAAQHLQVGFEAAAPRAGWARDTACQPVAMASTKASSAEKVLVSRTIDVRSLLGANVARGEGSVNF